jgi:hypothetical protein
VFQVKEQINGSTSSSRLVGAAAVPNGTNAVASLFLLDAERKALTLCERDAAGAWQVVRNLPLPVSDFSGLQAVALNDAKPNSVAFLGLNSVAWMPLQGETWEFSALDGYETPIKDGYLTDVITGDLDNDGEKNATGPFEPRAVNDVGIAFQDRPKENRIILRRVLQIRILDDHVSAFDIPNGGLERGSFPHVVRVIGDGIARLALVFLEQLASPVR